MYYYCNMNMMVCNKKKRGIEGILQLLYDSYNLMYV